MVLLSFYSKIEICPAESESRSDGPKGHHRPAASAFPPIHPSIPDPSVLPSIGERYRCEWRCIHSHLLNLHLKRERKREVRYQTLAAAESASGNSSHFFTSGHTEWAIGNHVFKIMTGVRFWLHRFGANISPQPLVGPYLRSVCM